MTRTRPHLAARPLRLALPALALALGLGAAGVANADSDGAWARVVSVSVVSSGSDDFGLVRGKLVVAERRTARNKPIPVSEYVWGGNTCPGRDLTADQVALLQDALAHRAHLRILPKFKNGQGGAKCLVAFEIRGREAIPGPPEV